MVTGGHMQNFRTLYERKVTQTEEERRKREKRTP
jgi:hypothetical protein